MSLSFVLHLCNIKMSDFLKSECQVHYSATFSHAPEQDEHMTEQNRPDLRHVHFFLHPTLHPQLMIFKILSGAPGRSLKTGDSLPLRTSQPQSVGWILEFRSQCWTAKYVRYEWKFALAEVGGKTFNWKLSDVTDLWHIFFMYFRYLSLSKESTFEPPYNVSSSLSPAWATSSNVLLGWWNAFRTSHSCWPRREITFCLPMPYKLDTMSQPVIACAARICLWTLCGRLFWIWHWVCNNWSSFYLETDADVICHDACQYY